MKPKLLSPEQLSAIKTMLCGGYAERWMLPMSFKEIAIWLMDHILALKADKDDAEHRRAG